MKRLLTGAMLLLCGLGQVGAEEPGQPSDPMQAPEPTSAPAATPAAAPVAAPAAARAGKTKGFAFAVRLERVSDLRINLTGGGTTATTSGFDFTPGFFVGYKTGALLFGGELAFARVATASSADGTPDRSNSNTTLELVPGIQLTLAHAAPLELYGEFDLALGHVFTDQTPSNSTTTDTNVFGYRIGAGLRYWMNPSFAFSALAGWGGDAVYTDTTTTTAGVDRNSSNSTGFHNLFGRFELLGVF